MGGIGLKPLLDGGMFEAARAAELYALCLAIGQGFLGALGDELSLYLGREAEGKGNDLGLQVVAQLEAVLDGVDATAFVEALAEEVEHHIEAAAETGDLGGDDKVVRPDATKEVAQPAIADALGACDDLLIPAIDLQLLLEAVLHDFVTLVLERLLIG